ncbi:MAG: hypothetical protein PWP64_1536 [Candidatus Cloacimonadota bacterium]|nr:hypothetical protein [Candidatus Cloacimonadota bacterium]
MHKVMFISLMFIACILYGQTTMQGPYYIGGTAADYADLDDAIVALHAANVTGNVQLYFNPGTYTGPYDIDDLDLSGYNLLISALTNDNGEVVLGNNATDNSNNFIIRIHDTDNVVIDNLDFAPTGTYARSIVVVGDSNDLLFQNNRFFNFGSSSDNNESLYFQCEGSNDADDVQIRLNQFFDGGYHIKINASDSRALFSDWDIYANIHQGGYYGVYLKQVHNLSYNNNQMHDANVGFGASSLSGSLDVSKNRIHAWAKGMDFVGCDPVDPGSTPNVYNNMITVSGYNWYGGNGSVEAYGLVLNQCEDIYAAHNSVELSSADSRSIACYLGGSGNTLRKNMLINTATGYALFFSNVDQSNSDPNTVEYNNIYSRGSYLGKQLNTSYLDIDQMNALFGFNNLDYNPHFTDADLHTSAPRLDNYGPYVQIAEDIAGTPRSTTAPDPGCWEFSSDPGMTRLAGTYNIGQGEDFETISDFSYALSFRGIIAAVTGNLVDAAYNEQIAFDRIPGSGQDRIVTLRSDLATYPTISYSAQSATANYVLALYRSQYMLIERINFSTESSEISNIIGINSYAKDITFRWCNFSAPIYSGTYPNNKCSIAIEDEVTTNIKVVASVFNGNALGIYAYGTDLEISACSFSNIYNGIQLSQTQFPYIGDNLFEGITHYAIISNGSISCNIMRNRVLSSSGGFYISNSPSMDQRNLIANNFVQITGSGSGITIGGGECNVLNNSVYVQNTNDNSSAFYWYQTAPNVDIVNNIFVCNLGLAAQIPYYNPDPSIVIDYNCYYTEGNYLVQFGQLYTSISAMQDAYPESNVHSVRYNPLWDDDLQIHSQYLRAIGSTRSEFSDDLAGNPRIGAWDIGAQQQIGINDLDPLSGTYSVGSAEADYPSLEEFLAALHYHGIDGSVNIQLAPGTYDGGYQLKYFPSDNEEWMLSFSGDGIYTINPGGSLAADNYFMKLIAVHNVAFTFMNMQSSSSTLPVQFFNTQGRCENIIFSYMGFDLPTSISTAIHTGTSLGDGLTIMQSTFSNPGYGLYIKGDNYDANHYQNIIVSANSFNSVSYPVVIYRASRVMISANQMNNFTEAIYLYNVDGEGGIYRNKLITTSTGSGNACVELHHIQGLDSENVFGIYKNIVYLNNSVCAVPVLYIYNGNLVDVVHNTLVAEMNGSTDTGSAFYLRNCSQMNIINNVISAPQKGYALRVLSSSDLTWQSNTYFSNRSDLGQYLGTYYRPLALISQQLNDPTGTFANALTNDNGYNECSYLRMRGVIPTFDTDIDNIPWSSGAGTDPGANVIIDAGAPIISNVIVGGIGTYADPEAAFNALMKRGVAGHVTVLVAPGTYGLNMDLGHIPGTHNGSRVKVIGSEEGEVVFTYTAASSSDNHILRLTGTQNLSFENIIFTTANPQFGTALSLNIYNEALQIRNCIFYGAGGNSSNASALYGYNATMRDFVFEHNTVQSLGYGIKIYDNTSYGSYLIQNNNIDQTNIGFSLAQMAEAQILSNVIHSSSNALSISNINSLLLDGNELCSATDYAVYISPISQSTGSQDYFNNYMRSSGTSALYFYRTPNVRMYHNTVVSTSTNSNHTAFSHGNQSEGLDARNNIFVAASGIAAAFNSFGDIGTLSNNIYYSASGIPVKLGGESLMDITAYQSATMDNNSLYADPLLQTGEYALQSGSEAIDAGVLLPDVLVDIEGNLRNLPDIGCYEYINPALIIPQNVRIVPSAGYYTLVWDEVPGAASYIVYCGNNPDAASWQAIPVQNTYIFLDMEPSATFFKVSAVTNR